MEINSSMFNVRVGSLKDEVKVNHHSSLSEFTQIEKNFRQLSSDIAMTQRIAVGGTVLGSIITFVGTSFFFVHLLL